VNKAELLQLMAYADGELSDEERDEIARLVDADETAGQVAEQMGTLGDVIRAVHADRTSSKAVATFDIADAVMADVADVEPERPSMSPSQPVAKVHSLEDARRRRVGLAAGVAAALALAAGFIVMARNGDERTVAEVPVTPVTPVTPSAAPSPEPAPPVQVASADPVPAQGGPGVEVDAIESPGHSVSVFYLPNANEVSTSVVVWIDETGEK
jgi:negative regulator of sigma E activity